MTQPSKHKRKKLIVNREFQWQMTGVFLTTFLVGILLTIIIFTAGIITYTWMNDNTGEGQFGEFFVQYVQEYQPAEVLKDDGTTEIKMIPASKQIPFVKRWEIVVPAIIINNLLILVILGVLITVISIRFSHRIAGPLWNINRSLDLAAQGKLEKEIRLRKRDFFHDTAEKINRILHSHPHASPKPPHFPHPPHNHEHN